MRAGARVAKEFDVITTLPNFSKLVPATILGAQTLQATVGPGSKLSLLLNGKPVKSLKAGTYNFAVYDRSKAASFRLQGPGVKRSTSGPRTGLVTWTVTLQKAPTGTGRARR